MLQQLAEVPALEPVPERGQGLRNYHLMNHLTIRQKMPYVGSSVLMNRLSSHHLMSIEEM
jgi:hypothetical protein